MIRYVSFEEFFIQELMVEIFATYTPDKIEFKVIDIGFDRTRSNLARKNGYGRNYVDGYVELDQVDKFVETEAYYKNDTETDPRFIIDMQRLIEILLTIAADRKAYLEEERRKQEIIDNTPPYYTHYFKYEGAGYEIEYVDGVVYARFRVWELDSDGKRKVNYDKKALPFLVGGIRRHDNADDWFFMDRFHRGIYYLKDLQAVTKTQTIISECVHLMNTVVTNP